MNDQKSKDFSKKNFFGFTIIELLTIITIISIITSIIFLNWRLVGEDLKLQQAANKLTQDIRKVSEMAISAKECPTGTSCQGQVPQGGYGIYFEKIYPASSEYSAFLYADNSSDVDQRYDSNDVIIENIFLEKEIKILNVEDSNDGNQRFFCVNFKPPNPTVKLSKWEGGGTGVTNELNGDLVITLSLKKNESKTKTIRVNKIGLVYVK